MANGEPPIGDSGGQAPDLDLFAKALAGALSQLGDFTILKAVPTNLISEGIALLLSIPLKLLGELIVLAAQTLIIVLGTAHAETDQLASVALTEVFGTDIQASSIRGGGGGGAQSALGATLLANLLQSATSAGGSIGPSAAPAEAFLGELLGVSIRAWLLEFITDLIPESFRIAPFNGLIEGVLRTTGLARLSRVALQPAIKAAVATPLEWLVNDSLRPTLLSEGQAVKAFQRGKWSAQQLDNELGAKGYSADRIEDVINDLELRLSISDVQLLATSGTWSAEEGLQYLKDSGYPDQTAQTILSIPRLRQLETLGNRAIAAYEIQYKRGELSDSGFRTALGLLKIEPDVINAWQTILAVEQAAGFKVLDLTQLKAALLANVISLPEWRQGLTTLGYSPNDITVLELTEQGVLASKEAAASAKAAAKAAAAQAKAQAKADAAAAKAAKTAAAAAAKAQAAIDKKTAAQAKAATLLEKQQLLAQQAQARRDQIAKASAAKLLTVAEANQQLAAVQLAETQAADAVKTQQTIAASTDQAESQAATLELNATATADQAARDSAAATAQADAQEAALTERRAERIANYQAQRDQVDQEEAAGLLTAATAQKKRDTIQTAENAAIKAERLDQLAIARARKQAVKTSATAAAKAAKATAAVALVPTAAARKAATIAAGASQLAQVKAKGGSSTAAARANIAAASAGAIDTAATQLDALNAQLLADYQAFEKAHGPQ